MAYLSIDREALILPRALIFYPTKIENQEYKCCEDEYKVFLDSGGDAASLA
ncbi:hypothetical protein KSX_12410 [Ktedonospora formicarum]|uniref:Uncharacterized protein n=1 Tax=Ktedonospora formicarum TaxID=2778364 RepID=A0A8J3MQX5_9CHLR|nr:hypothetical protein KSX_12410 [Ktedonospora formicarum]